jgi:hypothetical protein
MPTSDDALLVAIAAHILVFPPGLGGPTGLHDLNGVAHHWHNRSRVVASSSDYTATLKGRSFRESVFSRVRALIPNLHIVHFFSAAYEACAGYLPFHAGKMKNVRVCFGWTADGRDRVIRFKHLRGSTVYVHVLDGLGNVTVLSSDDFLDRELYVNVMSGGGWLVDKSHNGSEDSDIAHSADAIEVDAFACFVDVADDGSGIVQQACSILNREYSDKSTPPDAVEAPEISSFTWLKTQTKNPLQGSIQARVMGFYWKLVCQEVFAPDWLDNPRMTDVQRYSIALSRSGAMGGLCSAFDIVLRDDSAMVLLRAAAGKLVERDGGPQAVESEATVLFFFISKRSGRRPTTLTTRSARRRRRSFRRSPWRLSCLR